MCSYHIQDSACLLSICSAVKHLFAHSLGWVHNKHFERDERERQQNNRLAATYRKQDESSNEAGSTQTESNSGLRTETFRALAVSYRQLGQNIEKYVIGLRDNNTHSSPELKSYENS